MVTKNEIVNQIEKGKRPTKEIVIYYGDEIRQRVNYDIILDRIKEEFDYDLSYGSLVMAVKRHLKSDLQEKNIGHSKIAEQVLIDNSTPSKEITKKIKQNKVSKDWGFVDGPVSKADNTSMPDL